MTKPPRVTARAAGATTSPTGTTGAAPTRQPSTRPAGTSGCARPARATGAADPK